MLHMDDNIPPLMSFLHISMSFNDFIKPIIPINDHFQLSRLNKFFQEV